MQGSIKTIGIAGTGTMGIGIAEIVARANYSVLLLGRDPIKCNLAIEAIRNNLQNDYSNTDHSYKKVKKVLSKITIATINDFSRVDLVIEALPENIALKKELFRKLDTVTKKDCIFASNTSSIPISLLAEATNRPHRFIGMHFMNPPRLVCLIEIICGKKTLPSVFSVIYNVAKRMKRYPIIKSLDTPGFTVNRIILSAINEAAKIIENGIAKMEDVNNSVILAVGSGRAMSVLELADLIGIDICVDILNILEKELGQYYKPANIFKKMIASGNIGRKSGKGFLKYKKGKCIRKNTK